MKEKISKIMNVMKKDGFFVTAKKMLRYINARYVNRYNIFSKLYYKINHKKFEKIIYNILREDKYERIIIMRENLGWNIPLFQRPQHIARQFSKNDSIVFYEVTTMTDKVKKISKISENLYLINRGNCNFYNIFINVIQNEKIHKYVDYYSTDFKTPVSDMVNFINKGFKIIYEYIDDMSPSIVGTTTIPKNMQEKYDFMINHPQDVFVVVTADRLKEDVITKRGNEKLILACNGVDYEHFQDNNIVKKVDEQFENILKENKKIIGYYGALASWMDYDILRYIAEKKKDCNIILFGVKYDDSYKKSKIQECANVYFLGNKNYEILPYYAKKFDICIIPFKINEITRATSPVKLFEYMAMEKPIVTTDMDECRKYKSVYIAQNKDDFVKQLDEAIKKQNDKEYKDLLRKEALENTWYMKSKSIIELVRKYE